ncbi:chemotaxis protein CheW [Sessilibacter corallicola]|uniref:chemotaxis protein CheW n=1 Tax=Sessilibacter corallicola TaxID=2904075 RepID=UPI001E2AD7CC|nr:chemotaxis protein CheW [Sessilibacter corallicola]
MDAEETSGGALESYFSDLLDPALTESELEKRLAQARLDKSNALSSGHKGTDNIVSLSSHVTNALKKTETAKKTETLKKTDDYKEPAAQAEPHDVAPSSENNDKTKAANQSVNVHISVLKKWLNLVELQAYSVDFNPEYSIGITLPKQPIVSIKTYAVNNNFDRNDPDINDPVANNSVRKSSNINFSDNANPEDKKDEIVQPKLQEKPTLERTDNNELDIAIDLKNRNEQLQKLLNDSALKSALIQSTDVDLLPKAATATKLETDIKTDTSVKTEATLKLETNVKTELEQEITQHQAVPTLHWLKDEIDILLFRINDLELALPLVTLGRVQIIGDSLSAPFGQIHWVLGLLPSKKGMIQVVDSAEFLLPEQNTRHASKPYSYLISFDQSKWALAVDEIGESIRLDKERIKWRTRESATPWFTGTLRDRMCTILDPVKLQTELSNYDKTDQRQRKTQLPING